jgi:hypothetical protein
MKPSWREWNDVIGRAIFSVGHAGRIVYLAIDQEEIGRFGDEFGLEPRAAYESFRAAVIAEVRHGWPNPCRPVKAGEYPRYLGVLVAQVVAAFQMHDDGHTSAKAYWRRLREFLGQSSEDRKPDGLKGRDHKLLWRGLERWANETNGGRLGRVRIVGKRRGHHLVAEPLGQCLLRRGDLEKLRALFVEYGRPDPEPYRGRRLRDLLGHARTSLAGRYFTKHGLRVLDDPDRLDAAWEQIEAEYERFLAEERLEEESPEFDSEAGHQRPGRRTPRLVTMVLLQIGRRGLSGGLYRREEGKIAPVITDVGEVLRRCYLRDGREGSKPPHEPPHDGHLLATRDDESGAFAESRTCRAGQDVLLLIPETDAQSWLNDADSGLFEGSPRRYRPTHGADRPGWEPLDGLPNRWLVLRFRTRDDLSGVILNGKWIGGVDRRGAGVRTEGGLTLRRGVWLVGAGPAFRVVGPGRFHHILIDGQPHPLDTERRAIPRLDVGEHRVRLPGQVSRGMRVRIAAPRSAAPSDTAGWHRVEGGWPASAADRHRGGGVPAADTLHGARMDGGWPAYRRHEPEPDALSDELAALMLAVSLRTGRRGYPPGARLLSAARTATAPTANPLLLGLLRAGHPATLIGTDEA